MSGLNPVLGFAAGALTILSPCVLPLVPLVLGSAARANRWGPLALAGGLVVSFTATGFALATIGASIGLDGDWPRLIGAVLLCVIGAALLIPWAQHLAERLATPLAGWAGERQQRLERFGVAGQAAIGALLGLVWSPCVGPTLGAATVLAAQGRDLGQVALTMFGFGLGIATVLLGIALAGRSLLSRVRGRLLATGGGGRRLLGGLLALTGVFILTGLDRTLEGKLVEVSPDWLVSASSST